MKGPPERWPQKEKQMASLQWNLKYDTLIERMGGLRAVERLVPADMNRIHEALNNGDEHLNSIPMRRWDLAAGLLGDGKVTFNLSFAPPWTPDKANGLSLAERVCILKRAATRVANGEVTE